jgi:hypothetical protein
MNDLQRLWSVVGIFWKEKNLLIIGKSLIRTKEMIEFREVWVGGRKTRGWAEKVELIFETFVGIFFYLCFILKI